MDDQHISKLARKIDDLIKLCSELDRENKLLKAASQDWYEERRQLKQKTEAAHKSVEAMIARLKEMEQNHEPQ